jgi:hypothetical protein
MWTALLHNGRERAIEAEELAWGYDGRLNDDGTWQTGTLLAFNDDAYAWDPAAAWQPCPPGSAYLFTNRKAHMAGRAWTPRENRSEIFVNELDRATAKAWEALEDSNELDNASEFIFRHGDVPSRLEHNDDGRLIPRELIPSRMRYRLNQIAIWQKPGKEEGTKYVLPAAPMDVVSNVLATPDPPLPVLDQIVDVPTLGRDGRIHDDAGYSASSRMFYDPADGLTVPTVAARPSKAERARARELITQDLFGDFPFVGEPELAHAVAMLIQPFVRAYFSGPSPLFLVEAPTPGTGKSLLVKAACWPAVGASLPAMTEGKDEDEWRKRITAKLMDAPVAVLIDNLRDPLDSAALSAVLTLDVWEDRKLGKTEMCTLPNKTTWTATGNNPQLSGEITRRSVRIRLDAGVEHPEDRKGFKHSDLDKWVAAHRGELVWAALTLARAWIVAGAKPGEAGLGSFEAWASCLGGILRHAGIEGFLQNVQELRDSSHSEHEQMLAFLTAWHDFHGEAKVLAKDVGHPAEALGVNPFDDKGVTAIGRYCSQHRDRRFGDLIIRQAGRRGGKALWQVLRAE